MQATDYNFRDKTIIIAEDEDANYRFIREILIKAGAEVRRAVNGNEVIDIVKTTDVDLVLMDIKMPGMNGYEATILIKEIKPNLPVIAQTAYAHNNDRDEVLALGCDNYIAKPIERRALLEMVSSYLG